MGGGGGTWVEMLEVALFLVGQWYLGRVFRKIHAPVIVAEMIAGIMLGPEVLDLVPYVHKGGFASDGSPSIWTLLGNMGVALMIFESGMHLQFDTIAKVGKQATIVAVVGTFFPIIVGVLFAWAIGFEFFPDALSIGMTLAPTSVGISLQMLSERKFLNSVQGQIIVTAAFIDDIFSLVLLDILINAAKGSITAGTVILPMVKSFAFVIGGAVLALKVMPNIKYLVNRVGENKKASFQPKDELHLSIMCAVVCVCGYIGSKIGSHLLGTFVAGLLFCEVPRSGLIWTRQFKRILAWLVRLFFSASIGFSIPINSMITAEAFLKGTAIAIVPCIGGKLVSGLHMGDAKWIIGWAMSARGEFAYLVAQTAKDAVCESCGLNADGSAKMMLSDASYSALLWALVWPKIAAPLFFGRTLDTFIKKQEHKRPAAIGGGKASQANQKFALRLVGMHHPDVLHEVMDVLHNEGFDVLEIAAESDGFVDSAKFVLKNRGDFEVDDEKLHEVATMIKDAVNDEESQVVFEALDLESNLDAAGVLQIKMMGDHHPDILHEVFDMLAEHDLDVMRAVVAEHQAMDDHESHIPARLRTTSLVAGGARRRGASFTGDNNTYRSRSNSQPHGDATADAAADAVRAVQSASVSEFNNGPFGSGAALKEMEIIYARHPLDEAGERPKIDGIQRAMLREKINAMLVSHACHGEVMLRMVPEELAHEDVQPITAIQQDDQVAIVTTHGTHHPALIHEVLDALAQLGLDVLHADIVQPDSEREEDHSTFYVRKVDADAAVPATEREARREIRDKLTVCFSNHQMDGHVSVRPLDKTLAGQVISADEQRVLERGEGGVGDDLPPRTVAEEDEEEEDAADASTPVATKALEGALEGKAE